MRILVYWGSPWVPIIYGKPQTAQADFSHPLHAGQRCQAAVAVQPPRGGEGFGCRVVQGAAELCVAEFAWRSRHAIRHKYATDH